MLKIFKYAKLNFYIFFFFFRIVDKTLQMKIKNKHYKNPIVILNITDYKLRFFHWFSIGSNTVAHWTLYCNGPESTFSIIFIIHHT